MPNFNALRWFVKLTVAGLGKYARVTMRGNADKLYAAFGELVMAHRRRLMGMTQAQLGRRIGLSRASVTNIEQGRHHVSLDQFLRIAVALDVAPEALLPRVSRKESGSRLAGILPEGLPKDIVDWADRL